MLVKRAKTLGKKETTRLQGERRGEKTKKKKGGPCKTRA